MNSTEESGSVPSVVEADVVLQNPSSNPKHFSENLIDFLSIDL